MTGVQSRSTGVRLCPVCRRPAAPNGLGRGADDRVLPADPRCGPCYNFGLVGFDDGRLSLRVSFREWLEQTGEAMLAEGTLEGYDAWRAALEREYEAHETHMALERALEGK